MSAVDAILIAIVGLVGAVLVIAAAYGIRAGWTIATSWRRR